MKKIDDNLLAVFNCLTKNRQDWIYLTDEQKEKWFFIINRNFSKKYLKQSQLLNHKNIDKVLAFDLWYHYMENKPYPNWFWSKSDKKPASDISTKDFNLLLKRFNIKDTDLDYLIKNHEELIKEELKYLKDLQKN